MYNKVFISYATEDYQYADNLHDFLSKNGFEPWMDKKNLLRRSKLGFSNTTSAS
ncbi:MAG: toll/interleukin-1 receptor domain-containing protein [Sphingobacteriaceae bacterium]|nr:toll/interleukin-1 receptor domain-containing protein [Sphingobacteriaceae bacterium]